MESLREIKQVDDQALPEATKCDWINTKGNKIGQVCGKTAVSGRYCSTHKKCNPDLQAPLSRDDVSEITEKLHSMSIDNGESMIEIDMKEKVIRIKFK